MGLLSVSASPSVHPPIAILPPTVIADEGQRIDIPDGCVLENRAVQVFFHLLPSLDDNSLFFFFVGLVSGSLNMIVSSLKKIFFFLTADTRSTFQTIGLARNYD